MPQALSSIVNGVVGSELRFSGDRPAWCRRARAKGDVMRSRGLKRWAVDGWVHTWGSAEEAMVVVVRTVVGWDVSL